MPVREALGDVTTIQVEITVRSDEDAVTIQRSYDLRFGSLPNAATIDPLIGEVAERVLLAL